MHAPLLALPFALAALSGAEGFSTQFASPGIPEPPTAMCTFDDGRGPALFVGGSFEAAGTVSAHRVARWDGRAWEALGQGPDLYVDALAVFDDGSASGPALYAAGAGTNALHRWDGTSWTVVPSALKGTYGGVRIRALTVADGASGSELIAAGDFTQVAGVKARSVARFDGTTWSPLGLGLDGWVVALATYDDGAGPALFAAGHFRIAGPTYHSLARWDGSSWSAVGAFDDVVRSLAVYDSGSGPELIAGGRFTQVDSVAAGGVARWNGTAWAPVGGGVGAVAQHGLSGSIDAVSTHALGGDGPELVVGGIFESIDDTPASNLAAWDGSRWRPLGDGVAGFVLSLASVHLSGSAGRSLLAAGAIGAGAGPHGIAAWDGARWSPLNRGQGLWRYVTDLLAFDDGSGTELYACGSLGNAGGVAAGPVTKWDGERWSSFGTPLSGPAESLTVFDDGTGPALYAGGGMTWIGDAYASGIARWDGRSWAPVGGGVIGTIFAQAVYDDGSGPALFAAGDFQYAGTSSLPVWNVARWDGESWSGVGGGVDGTIDSLAVYDDGFGPALFAAGNLYSVNNGGSRTSAKGLVRYDGVAWSPVPGAPGLIRDMRVLDLGGGERLYFAGAAQLATGPAAVWSWDGSTWESVGDGASGLFLFGDSLGVHERDGSSILLASGSFVLGPDPVAVALFDGSRWSEVASADGPVNAMATFAGGVFLGGFFTTMGGVPASCCARWDGR